MSNLNEMPKDRLLWPGVHAWYAESYRAFDAAFVPFYTAGLSDKPLTRWQRLKYKIKQPFWKLQDWICKHVCHCEDY